MFAVSFCAMDPVLELRRVSKHYTGHVAVNDISLLVEQGAFYSLLGPSGCGKTTTLRLIAGFEAPTAGDVLLSGAVVNKLPAFRRNVSTVFQSYALFPHLTVEQNVAFGLRERGVRDTGKQVGAALAMVHLNGKEKRLPVQLSGGERQRVALARSLVLKPAVLLLDEPLAALDPKLRKQMRTELKAMQREAEVTFLFVTHDQEEALSMSDRIAVMNGGRVEQVGTAREVYLRPATRFVAGFLGAVNWMGDVGVRPECFRLEQVGKARSNTATGAGVQARVLRSEFLGNVTRVWMVAGSGESLLAEARQGEAYLEGDCVRITWDGADEIRI